MVVAEGALPKPGTIPFPEREVNIYGHERLGGNADLLAAEIELRTGFESRSRSAAQMCSVEVHRRPSTGAATRFGMAAIDAVHDGAFGKMVALQAAKIVRVPLAEAVGSGNTKRVPHELVEVADVFYR